MKIHLMSGWDFPTTSIGGSGSSIARGAIPNTMFEIMAVSGDEFITATVTALGWMSVYTTVVAGNWGNNRNRIHGNLKTAIPSIGPTSNLFHGIRYSVASVSPDSQVLSYMSSYDAGDLVVFSKTDLPGYAVNKEYYLEHQLDFVNGVVNRWVDSKPLASLPIPAALKTAVSATPGASEIWLALGSLYSSAVPQGSPCYWSWRDMYYIEWEAGEKPQPLGPVVINKLPVSAVGAPAWTPSTGTPTSVLKLGYSNPTNGLTVQTVTTDDAMAQGSITYDASSIPLNAKVKGVAVKGRTAVTVNATANMGVSLTAGGAETADANTAMVATQTFYDRMYSSDKNPSGQAWTQPNLAELTVKVKPKV